MNLDKYYSSFSNHEMALYRDRNVKPYMEIVKYDANAMITFNKQIRYTITNTDNKYSLKKIAKTVLVVTISNDIGDRVQEVSDIISMVEIIVNGRRIQRYTGKFLEILDNIQGRKGLRFNNNVDGNKEICIEIPFNPDLDKNNVLNSRSDNDKIIRYLEELSKFQDNKSDKAHYLGSNTFPIGLLGIKNDGTSIGKKGGGELEVLITFSEKKETIDISNAYLLIEYESIPLKYDFMNELRLSNALKERLHEIYWKHCEFAGKEQIFNYKTKINAAFCRPIETLYWRFMLIDRTNNSELDLKDFRPFLKTASIKYNDVIICPELPAVYFNQVVSKKLTDVNNISQHTYCWTFISNSELLNNSNNEPKGSFSNSKDDKDLFLCLVLDMSQIPSECDLFIDLYAHTWDRLKFRDGDCGLLWG